jgi:hypothetical protein
LRDNTIQWCGGGELNGGGTRWGDAVDIEGVVTGTLMDRNFVYQMYDGGLTIQTSGAHSDNTTIRNNIIWNTSNPLFLLDQPGSGTNTLANLKIYNNTCYSPSGWAMVPTPQRPNGDTRFQLVFQKDSTVAVTNAALQNNVMANGVASCTILQDTLTEWQSGLTQDYNLWFSDPANPNSPTSFICGPGGTPTYQSIAAWALTIPVEQHGLIDINPAFTSPATGNFRPASNSPLLSAGVNLYNSGVVWDFNKNPRPASGPFTIGAFE